MSEELYINTVSYELLEQLNHVKTVLMFNFSKKKKNTAHLLATFKKLCSNFHCVQRVQFKPHGPLAVSLAFLH